MVFAIMFKVCLDSVRRSMHGDFNFISFYSGYDLFRDGPTLDFE